MAAIAEVLTALDAVHTGLVERQREALALAQRLDDLAKRYAVLFGTAASPLSPAIVARTALAARRLREGAQLVADATRTVVDVRAVVAGVTPPATRPASPTGARPPSARLRCPGVFA